VAWALREVLRADAEASRALAARLEVGMSDVLALQYLMVGPLGPVELAHRLGMRSASVTLLLDRLERAGHVRRLPHPEDGRRKVVEATDRARADVLTALRPLTDGITQAAAGLSPTEAAATLRFLGTVTKALHAYAKEMPHG
jgi:DNA-binding MarR family transcriptional regulator